MRILEADKVEILTLQDNYIDVTALDNSAVVQRASPLKDMQIKSSILAEHGFSALVTRPCGGPCPHRFSSTLGSPRTGLPGTQPFWVLISVP